MATKTGNSYTYHWKYSRQRRNSNGKSQIFTMASPNKVSPSDCDNERQPEMAMWPPKAEIFIPLELR